MSFACTSCGYSTTLKRSYVAHLARGCKPRKTKKAVGQQDEETVVTEAPPVVEAVVEAPVVEAPVVEAPVVEAPVVEAPVVEAPVEAPVETPVEAPVEAAFKPPPETHSVETHPEADSESAAAEETASAPSHNSESSCSGIVNSGLTAAAAMRPIMINAYNPMTIHAMYEVINALQMVIQKPDPDPGAHARHQWIIVQRLSRIYGDMIRSVNIRDTAMKTLDHLAMTESPAAFNEKAEEYGKKISGGF